ncbi:MAG: hypothetical protein FJ279_05935 [Planctomycetes bacterium]|nr:hypothetical protein [Planctomycetota bacterium]
MFTDSEYEVLARFKKGEYIGSDLEKEILYKYASIGLVRLGFHDDEERQCRETARLSPLGARMLHRERILRNPVKRFLYQLFSPLF